MDASYSIIQKENEYRILLTSVNTGSLSNNIQEIIRDRDIHSDIVELLKEDIKEVSGK